jgi:hypothetical protein
MPIEASLQKRRQLHHGKSVLWPRRVGALQSALRALEPRRRCLVLSPSPGCVLVILTAGILLPMLLTSCGKEGQAAERKTVQKSEDDFLDKDAKPDERKYLMAAKPFVIAVANRKYADAYALLSRYAIARMSLEPSGTEAWRQKSLTVNRSCRFEAFLLTWRPGFSKLPCGQIDLNPATTLCSLAFFPLTDLH